MRTPQISALALRLGAFHAALLLSQAAFGVTFSVSPNSVTNQYSGLITLQIAGLNTGETVNIQRYVDANGNGAVDAADYLSQSFQLTDNQGPPVIAGVTNINVPGDLNSANGSITAQLNPVIETFGGRFVAQYIFVLSSPTARFSPVTALFSVTSSTFSQTISGTVTCDGTNVPDAIILLFAPKSGSGGDSGGFNPSGGGLANNAGVYSLKLAPGSYQFAAFKYGFVTDTTKAATVTLASGATVTTNLSLVPATTTISGKLVDAANPGVGLPGILLGVQSSAGLFALGSTISNGGFSLTVTSGQWQGGADSQGFALLDYVGLNNGFEADTSTGSVAGLTFALPKATAYIYGSVRDAQNNPLPGVGLSGDNGLNGNGTYEGDATTDQNGNYVMGVVAGVWSPNIGGGGNSLLYGGYIFSGGPAWTFNNGGGGTNLGAGAVAQANFTALPATNLITGSLKDGGGNPIANVDVYAYATINGATFNQDGLTDANGNYSMNVGNGSWTVDVNCCNNCGGNSLPSNYSCPNQQTVGISNNNGAADFVASSFAYQISGALKDSSGNPIQNVAIYANATINGTSFNQNATTDANGAYSIGVGNGSWTVGVNCCAGCGNTLPSNDGCPNQQTINISNGNQVVNFVAPLFAFQITGSLKDGGGNAITNVQISAAANISGSQVNQSAVTDANGNYSVSVASGSWSVGVNCCNNCGGNPLPSNYDCPNQQTVGISNGNQVANFVAEAADASQIGGSVTDANGDPVGGVTVTASASGNQNALATTSSNGTFTLFLAPGNWVVSLDCNSLTALGYACPGSQTVQVSPNQGNSLLFTVQPCGPLQVTTLALNDAFIGSNYTFQLLTSGCHPPFVWSLTPGSLPPPQGLLLSTNGVVGGSPGMAGTNYFSARVTDGQGTKADGLVSIAVYPPLQITNSSLPNGTLGVAYSAQIRTTGGSSGFFGAFVTSGTLPPGLNLFGDAGISGTPTQLGTFQFTVQVTDNSLLDTADATFTITIAQPNLQITTTSVGGGVAGQPFSFQLQASGGAVPLVWSVALGSQPLPGGLTLATNGLISGTPGAGGVATVIIRVTDANALTTTAPVQIAIASAATAGSLGSPAFSLNNGFQFSANAPTGLNYTVQYSLSLTNWVSLFATNPSVTPFTIVDRAATNQHRFYRLMLPAP